MRRWCSISFLAALALFALAEWLARQFFGEGLAARFEYGFHPTAGFREKSDGTIQLERTGGRRFIPLTFRRERPPGTFRLMVVGNSVPYGPGPLADSFIWLAAEELRQNGIPAEGINLALVGQGALRNQVVLRQALRYQPSLIVLQVDAALQRNDEIDQQRRAEYLGWHPKVWPMKSYILRRLYEWRADKVYVDLLPDEIRARNNARDLVANVTSQARTESPAETDARLARFQATIRESIALARAQNIPVLLLTQAFLEPAHPAPGPSKLHLTDHGLDAFTHTLVTNGVHALSMKDIFTPLPADKLFADKNHLIKPGHQAVAHAIVESLRTNHLFTPIR